MNIGTISSLVANVVNTQALPKPVQPPTSEVIRDFRLIVTEPVVKTPWWSKTLRIGGRAAIVISVGLLVYDVTKFIMEKRRLDREEADALEADRLEKDHMNALKEGARRYYGDMSSWTNPKEREEKQAIYDLNMCYYKGCVRSNGEENCVKPVMVEETPNGKVIFLPNSQILDDHIPEQSPFFDDLEFRCRDYAAGIGQSLAEEKIPKSFQDEDGVTVLITKPRKLLEISKTIAFFNDMFDIGLNIFKPEMKDMCPGDSLFRLDETTDILCDHILQIGDRVMRLSGENPNEFPAPEALKNDQELRKRLDRAKEIFEKYKICVEGRSAEIINLF